MPRVGSASVVASETGGASWCRLLDAVRVGPGGDVAEVTARQVRRVVTDLLDGLPVGVSGRMRSDRVMRGPSLPPGHSPGRAAGGRGS
ncbi:hypothetical protein V1L54_27525 [Streptomyces sp. TRM 70361]|uniref:hypothetical protein n=1 Tax=Streptomyces sp. TRM 70361 TaxID=3116553 RepID=UPI002E7AD362|nr:hypothetical protein [Streptomyces sp. TRM 70361]MEE1943111.1 hypothetical protein [Streptomyces sp. TRM 70361]